MEIGTVFWIAIAYSLLGWAFFRVIREVLTAHLLKSKKENEISSKQIIITGSVLILGALLSGPMTWGTTIRTWAIESDKLDKQ